MTSPKMLTALLLAVLALPASAAAAARFGFNDNAALYGAVTPAAVAEKGAGAGADSVRVSVDWRVVEPARGTLYFETLDRIYAAALARGQRPLFTLLFAPGWARAATGCADPNNCKLPPTRKRLADWSRFAETVARRYPQAIGIEVWNEPNLKAFWDGPIDPVYYTELLKYAYAGVKRAVPQMAVVTGGLSAYYGEDGAAPGMGAAEFLNGMYRAGARSYFDGIGLHPYSGGLQLNYGYRALSSVLGVRAANGDASPLWLTELGATTSGGGIDEAVQGAQLARLAGRLRAGREVAGVYVHTLFEPSWVAPSDPERGFGVLRADGAPKPAWCALAARFAAATCDVPDADAVQEARWDAQDLLQEAAQAAIRYRSETGSYAGITSAALHARSPVISQTSGGDADLPPGPQADPSVIGVWPSADGTGVLACNASRAERSYCIWNVSWAGRQWIYGHADAGTWGAAGATTTGANWWW